MTITITNINDKSKYAKFIWRDDLQECHHIAFNIEDDEFQKLIKSKAYEGASLDGWIVDIE
tara:strand:- start:1026 stop:1208 length:183 start_codon:yes stop_codon:yes gene_type:complete